MHSDECGKQNGTTASEEIARSVDSTPNGNQQRTADTNTTHVRTMRAAASKALQKIKEWSGVLAPPPEDVYNCELYLLCNVVRTRAYV